MWLKWAAVGDIAALSLCWTTLDRSTSTRDDDRRHEDLFVVILVLSARRRSGSRPSRRQSLQAALGPTRPTSATARRCSSPAAARPATPRPGQEDAQLGGGLALKSPFGTFYAPNISSDPKDGIGDWTEAQFVTAMTEGHVAGRHALLSGVSLHVLSPAGMSICVICSPISRRCRRCGEVRDHDVPFPFNIRRLLGGWKLLFLDDGPFKARYRQSAQWNRGAYLVNAAGHCAECHSPRNVLGAIVPGQRFAGGPIRKARVDSQHHPGRAEGLVGRGCHADCSKSARSASRPGSMVRVVRNTSAIAAGGPPCNGGIPEILPPIEGPKRPRKEVRSPKRLAWLRRRQIHECAPDRCD